MAYMAYMAQPSVLKKTTVYLSDDDMLRLRKMANLRNITVAEAIRLSIKEACIPKNKVEKSAWDALERVWAKTQTLDTAKIEKAVDKAVKEVRGERNSRRRS